MPILFWHSYLRETQENMYLNLIHSRKYVSKPEILETYVLEFKGGGGGLICMLNAQISNL